MCVPGLCGRVRLLVPLRRLVPLSRSVPMRLLLPVHVIVLCHRAAATVIRTGLGREGRHHWPDGGSQPEQHVHNDSVIANQNAIGLELRGDVSVAYVPGEPYERRGVCCGDLHQLLRGGFHTDYPAVLQPQPVARAQHCRPREIQQKSRSATCDIAKSSAVSFVVGQYEVVDRRRPEPLSMRQDFDGANEGGHGESEEKIPLGHRQHGGRLAGEQLAVRPDLVRFGIDLDMRGR